jgi:hypothetical protein
LILFILYYISTKAHRKKGIYRKSKKKKEKKREREEKNKNKRKVYRK